MIDPPLEITVDGHAWSVDFPDYIDATYRHGKYDEHGVAHHGYALRPRSSRHPSGGDISTTSGWHRGVMSAERVVDRDDIDTESSCLAPVRGGESGCRTPDGISNRSTSRCRDKAASSYSSRPFGEYLAILTGRSGRCCGFDEPSRRTNRPTIGSSDRHRPIIDRL